MTPQKVKKRKPGGGRKAKAATLLKRRIVENKVEEAEASFAFLVAVRDNTKEPTSLRVAAAESILNRVLGKATEMKPDAGEELYKRHWENIQRVIFGHGPEQVAGTQAAEPGGD